MVNDIFLSVSPLSAPAKKVMIANIPPFISDELLVRELSPHGKIDQETVIGLQIAAVKARCLTQVTGSYDPK